MAKRRRARVAPKAKAPRAGGQQQQHQQNAVKPPPPHEFHLAFTTNNYTSSETERMMVNVVPWSEIEFINALLKSNSGRQSSQQHQQPIVRDRLSSQYRAADPIVRRAVLVADPAHLQTLVNVAAQARGQQQPQNDNDNDDDEDEDDEDEDKATASTTHVYCCTCSNPALFTTHAEWLAHRQDDVHRIDVRQLSAARLEAEMDTIYDEAEKFVRAGWDCPENPVVAIGRVTFDDGCPEHSSRGDKCPSWQAVIEAMSDETYAVELARREYGYHGCRGSKALRSIVCQSLDPARRSAQVYGPGEYCGKSANYSLGFSGDSDRMFVFMIFRAPLTSLQNHDNFYVVNNPADNRPGGQARVRLLLPVLIITFLPKALANNQLAAPIPQPHHQHHRGAHYAAQVALQQHQEAAQRDMALKLRRQRLIKERQQLIENAYFDGVFARPRSTFGGAAAAGGDQQDESYLSRNIIVVDFIIDGPPNTPLSGAELIGTFWLPREYPFKAPYNAQILTPNGRYNTFCDICLGHEDGWQPSICLSGLLLGLLSILTSERGEFETARTPPERVRRLAVESRETNSRLGAFVEPLRREFERAKAEGRAKAEEKRRQDEERLRAAAEAEEQRRRRVAAIRASITGQQNRGGLVVLDVDAAGRRGVPPVPAARGRGTSGGMGPGVRVEKDGDNEVFVID